MSVDEDAYAGVTAFCEECNAVNCPSRHLSYDEDGQEAIDFVCGCKHYQDACGVLHDARAYERGE
jgi:hypothetical protein